MAPYKPTWLSCYDSLELFKQAGMDEAAAEQWLRAALRDRGRHKDHKDADPARHLFRQSPRCLTADDGLSGIDPLSLIEVSRQLLTELLSEEQPTPAKGSPAGGGRRASGKKIKELVSRYAKSVPVGSSSSVEGLEQFAKMEGLVGHRDELRDEYKRQFPNQRVGRPHKQK